MSLICLIVGCTRIPFRIVTDFGDRIRRIFMKISHIHCSNSLEAFHKSTEIVERIESFSFEAVYGFGKIKKQLEEEPEIVRQRYWMPNFFALSGV